MGWFVTKTKFWSRGLGGGSAGRYLIAQSRPVLLMKIALVSARAFRQEPMRIRYHGIYSVRKSRLFASVEMSVGTRDSSAIRKSLDENWLPRPRQSARCPAISGGSGDSAGAQLLTKIYFSSRGLGGGSVGRYLIVRQQAYSLDENRACFRSGGQRGCSSELARWIWMAVFSVEVSPSRLCGKRSRSHQFIEQTL